MFPKKNRLLRKEIEGVLLRGLRTHSPHLVFVFLKNKQQTKDRFAVVVSKKVSLYAVERNKLKRRIRAILQKTQSKKNEARDGVIITKPKSIKLSHGMLKKEIEDLLKK